jgi:hypothetical protein
MLRSHLHLRRSIVRAHPCARLSRIDTLTNASVLPGVAGDYPGAGAAMECDTAQPEFDYVRSLRPLASPRPPRRTEPDLQSTA